MNKKLAEQHFRRAKELFQDNQPEEAFAFLGVLAEAFPNQKNILYAQAECLAAMGRVDEACSLCDRLVDEMASARAKQLRARLRSGSCTPGDIVEASAVGMPPPHQRRRRTVFRAVLSLSGVILLGAAAWYWVSTGHGALDLSPPSQDELHTAKAAVQVRRKKVEAQHEAARIAQAEALVTRPGQSHDAKKWTLTAIDGVPDWKPGAYERVPCPGHPGYTVTVYIPMAYQEKPAALLPWLMIQMPGGHPGFMGLEAWAEKREVILVAIDQSRNRQDDHLHQNALAQEAVLDTIVPTMRLDMRLGLAIGMSGGAKSSWDLVSGYPDNFAGLVMMGMGRAVDRPLAPPTRVGYIHGVDEPNNWAIEETIPRLRANGHEVREMVIPGAHVRGNVEQMTDMLDWMLSRSRRDNPAG